MSATFFDHFPQDTPIQRAAICDMSPDQIIKCVELFRERRMRAYTAYQEAQRIKAEAKSQKDAKLMEQRLTQLEKVFKSLDSNLAKAFKYANEVKLLAMTAGGGDD